MNSAPVRVADLIAGIGAGQPTPFSVSLRCGSCAIRVQSNSASLIDRLRIYFAPFLAEVTSVDIAIEALDMDPPELQLDFADWPRDAGKTGRKDSFVDLVDGRVCRKVRTGMQYFLGGGRRVVVGACLENGNQVINLVVSQYIGWLLNRGWALCHASGVVCANKGLAIAAFSGGGKSTLALHLMRHDVRFVSNDRMLIRMEDSRPLMCGVPKHPRINPGTVLNNPSLSSIISEQRRQELAGLESRHIWDLEEKYDALIDQVYGTGRFQLAANLTEFLILNWKRDTDAETRFTEIDIAARPDLLGAVMKTPGPFYIPGDAQAPSGMVAVNPADYLPTLSRLSVIEVTGQVDFERATAYCLARLA